MFESRRMKRNETISKSTYKYSESGGYHADGYICIDSATFIFQCTVDVPDVESSYDG